MIEIIKSVGDLILRKITEKQKIGEHVYTGTRYEIWTDNEKMNQGINGEDGFIYCRGFAGASEKEVTEIFDRMIS